MDERHAMRSLGAIAGGILFFGFALFAQDEPGRLQLDLAFDRQDYYEYEPIFAEWTLKNVGTSVVKAIQPSDPYFYTFRFAGEDGVTHSVENPSLVDLYPERHPVISLRPGESVKGVKAVLPFFGGRFASKGGWKGCAAYTPVQLDIPGLWRSEVVSNQVAFHVVEPAGQDAAAQKLVAEAISKAGGAPPSSVYYIDQEVCRGLMDAGGSKRFAAIAYFYLGRNAFYTMCYTEGRPTTAVPFFRKCIATEANRYLSGVCYYYLLVCKAKGATNVPDEESRRIADVLRKEYPDSWACAEAQRLAAEAKENPPPK